MYYPQMGVSPTEKWGERTLREILVPKMVVLQVTPNSGSLAQESQQSCGETFLHKDAITVTVFIYDDDGDRLSAQH